MKPQKTNKARYFKPGQCRVDHNIWLQRQRDGALSILLPSARFIFIKMNKIELLEVILAEHSLRLKFEDKIIDKQVGMGLVSSVLGYGQMKLPDLFRKHPSLFRPNLKSLRASNFIFGLLHRENKYNLHVFCNNNELQINLLGIKDTRLDNNVWLVPPPIYVEQAAYINWLIINAFNNKQIQQLLNIFVLEQFNAAATGYLNPVVYRDLNLLFKRIHHKKLDHFKELELSSNNVHRWVGQLANLAQAKESGDFKTLADALAGPFGRL